MLFVPSVDGTSHNPRERTPEAAIRDATATPSFPEGGGRSWL